MNDTKKRPAPFFPSLISLVVSVDVKHHVYLLKTSKKRRSRIRREGQRSRNNFTPNATQCSHHLRPRCRTDDRREQVQGESLD